MKYKLTYKTALTGEAPEDAEDHTRIFYSLEDAKEYKHQLDAYTDANTGLICFAIKLELD
tara:strand:+ start:7554 stop:7733 length:180 start_codon:yes stop_codon:yes gene_type:complete